MEFTGYIQNGIIVIDGNPSLPEGSTVRVTLPDEAVRVENKRRIEVPLIRTGEPGTLILTNQMINEFLDAEDFSS